MNMLYKVKMKSFVAKSKKYLQFDDLPNRFRRLGLDDSLVCPSNVVNTSSLQEKIKRTKDENPELRYHEDNEEYLKNIMAEIALITRRSE